ncbi:MAG: hypothetical protein ACRDBH_03030 [Bosea sp. (in: a-proteobacteria)]
MADQPVMVLAVLVLVAVALLAAAGPLAMVHPRAPKAQGSMAENRVAAWAAPAMICAVRLPRAARRLMPMPR